MLQIYQGYELPLYYESGQDIECQLQRKILRCEVTNVAEGVGGQQ